MKKIIALSLILATSFAMANRYDWQRALEMRTVSLDQAIDIAEEYTGARVYQIELDYSIYPKYEVTLFSGNKLYEIDINAKNGKVVNIEFDYEDDKDDQIDPQVISLKEVIEKINNQKSRTIVKIKYVYEKGESEYRIIYFEPSELKRKANFGVIFMDAKTGKIKSSFEQKN